jgi:hypothetical protein
MHVAFATSSAAGNHDLLPVLLQIGQQLARVGIVHQGAARNSGIHVFPALAVLLLAPPVFASACAPVRLKPEIQKRAQAGVGYENHITAVATVTPIRAPARAILFPAKTHATAPAVAATHVDFNFVHEFHGTSNLAFQVGT